ncbi:DUF4240 domain-containing protein [Streptomyces sp. ISL-10]|uniref:DUF4240 domain-containing protein n=1 Tax=Streptomyces sp. ISL-10 TaxID=2819172 RepID=UPI0027E52AA6|nr:DUF4240 domain-containing protein [Streptomyces sp. ISL-10]
MIAQGREWYERIAAGPDSLAALPLVIRGAEEQDRPELLFYEDVNYAADDAFERITGDADAFEAAWRNCRQNAVGSRAVVDMGEDFDFS